MKKKPSQPSLRRALLLRLLTPLVPLLLAGVGVAFYMSYHFVNEAYNRSLFRATLALADQVAVENGEVIVDLPQAAFEMLEYDKDDWIYYKVTGPGGEFITGYEDLPPPPVATPIPDHHYYYRARYEGKEISVAAFYLSLQGTSAHGMVLVQVAETTAKRSRFAQEIIVGMVLPQLLMVILATCMVWLGVGRGLVPLEKLRRQIASRSHRDLSPLHEVDSPVEVLPILEAMNGLIARLDQAMAQQQRFVADASHQLRTPLAGLKTQAEIALKEEDPAQLRHALKQIQTSSTSLAHMVSQLLSLARLEPGVVETAQREPVDLVSLAREVTGAEVPTALSKQIDLGFESIGSSQVQGNPALLRELLSNLIDNAVRYTQQGGQITVSVSEDDTHVTLAVEDNGPGIPEEQRERVFERFYRVLGTDQEGCGLGLSIVQEVARRHAAQVLLETPPSGQGTLFRVIFPRATA